MSKHKRDVHADAAWQPIGLPTPATKPAPTPAGLLHDLAVARAGRTARAILAPGVILAATLGIASTAAAHDGVLHTPDGDVAVASATPDQVAAYGEPVEPTSTTTAAHDESLASTTSMVDAPEPLEATAPETTSSTSSSSFLPTGDSLPGSDIPTVGGFISHAPGIFTGGLFGGETVKTSAPTPEHGEGEHTQGGDACDFFLEHMWKNEDGIPVIGTNSHFLTFHTDEDYYNLVLSLASGAIGNSEMPIIDVYGGPLGWIPIFNPSHVKGHGTDYATMLTGCGGMGLPIDTKTMSVDLEKIPTPEKALTFTNKVIPNVPDPQRILHPDYLYNTLRVDEITKRLGPDTVFTPEEYLSFATNNFDAFRLLWQTALEKLDGGDPTAILEVLEITDNIQTLQSLGLPGLPGSGDSTLTSSLPDGGLTSGLPTADVTSGLPTASAPVIGPLLADLLGGSSATPSEPGTPSDSTDDSTDGPTDDSAPTSGQPSDGPLSSLPLLSGDSPLSGIPVLGGVLGGTAPSSPTDPADSPAPADGTQPTDGTDTPDATAPSETPDAPAPSDSPTADSPLGSLPVLGGGDSPLSSLPTGDLTSSLPSTNLLRSLPLVGDLLGGTSPATEPAPAPAPAPSDSPDTAPTDGTQPTDGTDTPAPTDGSNTAPAPSETPDAPAPSDSPTADSPLGSLPLLGGGDSPLSSLPLVGDLGGASPVSGPAPVPADGTQPAGDTDTPAPADGTDSAPATSDSPAPAPTDGAPAPSETPAPADNPTETPDDTATPTPAHADGSQPAGGTDTPASSDGTDSAPATSDSPTTSDSPAPTDGTPAPAPSETPAPAPSGSAPIDSPQGTVAFTVGSPKVNGTPSLNAPGVTVPAGDQVTFTVPVTNTGDLPITTLVGKASDGGTLTGGQLPLAPGKTTTLTYTTTAKPGTQSTSFGIVGSNPSGEQQGKTCSAVYTGEVQNGEIATTGQFKANGQPASGDAAYTFTSTSPSTVSVQVTNEGSAPLENVTASSPAGAVTGGKTTLAPGETTWFTVKVEPKSGLTTVPFTFTGTDQTGKRSTTTTSFKYTLCTCGASA